MSTVIVTSETAQERKRNQGKRSYMWLGLGLLALCGIGAAFQAIVTEANKRNFPAPGQMVDVGGYQLHLLVTGTSRNAPTVILEAGTLAFSSYWAWVQPEISSFTRVVAYDRAGLGWSDSALADVPRDAQHIAMELHMALYNAGISGPYIFVAHSEGGMFATVFADLYQDEVIGLVLVEPQHPNAGEIFKTSKMIYQWGPLLARLGASRLMSGLFLQEADGTPLQLPSGPLTELGAFIPTVRMVDANAREVVAWDELTFPQVRAVKSLGSKPIIVLSGSNSFGDVWLSAQSQYAALSTNALQNVIEGETHGSLLTTREGAAVVVEAVHQVIESARSGKPLASK